MIFLPNDKMFPNRFTDVKLPTKREIFARTGQIAVFPAGSYTGDESAQIGLSPTEQADEFVRAAEAFEIPKGDAEE